MKYNMFKGMVHFGWYIDTYISLHILFKFLLPVGFFLASLKRSYSLSLVSPYTLCIFDFFFLEF